MPPRTIKILDASDLSVVENVVSGRKDIVSPLFGKTNLGVDVEVRIFPFQLC